MSIERALVSIPRDLLLDLSSGHVVKEINEMILDAVRWPWTAMTRRGRAGRKTKRGRKCKKAEAAAARLGPSLKEKASFVFRHRHLVVKRRKDLTESERDALTRMLDHLPALGVPWRLADRMYWLFDPPKDLHQASGRRAAIVRDSTLFRAVPDLVKALEQRDEEKIPKLMAYLRGPVSRRVRIENHVERTIRTFRVLEKVRYKWRLRRTVVRFTVLTLDVIWRETDSRAGERSRTSEADPVRHVASP
jgi:Transposase